MGWELITKLNLWLLLSMLPFVIQTGLITHIPECCLCSPSTETYLAPADLTLSQLFQNKSPTSSGRLYYSRFQATWYQQQPGKDMKTAMRIEGEPFLEV